MNKLFILATFSGFLFSCSRFDEPLTQPATKPLSELLDGESDFNSGFSPNLGYLTVFDHPTINLQEGAQYAKYMEFTFADNPNADGVECDVNNTDDNNISYVDSNSSGEASSSLSFRKLSLDTFFHWQHWTMKAFVVDEFVLETVDTNNTKTVLPLTLEKGSAGISFLYFDPDRKLVEGNVSISPNEGESEFEFKDASDTSYTGTSFSYYFVVKYCADLGTLVNPRD